MLNFWKRLFKSDKDRWEDFLVKSLNEMVEIAAWNYLRGNKEVGDKAKFCAEWYLKEIRKLGIENKIK